MLTKILSVMMATIMSFAGAKSGNVVKVPNETKEALQELASMAYEEENGRFMVPHSGINYDKFSVKSESFNRNLNTLSVKDYADVGVIISEERVVLPKADFEKTTWKNKNGQKFEAFKFTESQYSEALAKEYQVILKVKEKDDVGVKIGEKYLSLSEYSNINRNSFKCDILEFCDVWVEYYTTSFIKGDDFLSYRFGSVDTRVVYNGEKYEINFSAEEKDVSSQKTTFGGKGIFTAEEYEMLSELPIDSDGICEICDRWYYND